MDASITPDELRKNFPFIGATIGDNSPAYQEIVEIIKPKLTDFETGIPLSVALPYDTPRL